MGARKYSTVTPKKATKKKSVPNKNTTSKRIKKMILGNDDSLFDFESPMKNMANQFPIDGIEYLELTQTPTTDNPYNLRFDLPSKATYVLNHSTKFFIDFTLQQQSKKTDGTWDDWVPAESASKSNLVFYDGFIRKKFKTSFFPQ